MYMIFMLWERERMTVYIRIEFADDDIYKEKKKKKKRKICSGIKEADRTVVGLSSIFSGANAYAYTDQNNTTQRRDDMFPTECRR